MADPHNPGTPAINGAAMNGLGTTSEGIDLQPVTAESMERELRRVWRETVARDRGGDESTDRVEAGERDETPRVRAILSNLILLTSASHQIPRATLDQFITEVCIAFPSRIFVVEYDPTQHEPLTPFVSSRCVHARSGVRTCSEEVYLKVNAEGIPLVASLLTSFFVADVPRVLALPGDPIVPVLGGRELDWPFIRLFRRVLSVSDRVVFDSSRFKNFFQTVRLLLSSAEGQCDAEHEEDDDSTLEHSVLRMLSDLQWERSERWRSLIAELFDASVLQELLGELSCIRFTSVGSSLSAEAFLIGGWIVHALGLRVERAVSTSEIVCTLPYGKEVCLDFRSGKAGAGDEAGLEQVTFVLGDRKRGEVECSVEREGGRGELSVIVLEPGPISKTVRGSLRRVPFRRRSVEELFMQTMLAEGDVMFGASLLGAFRQAAVLEQVRRRGER